MRDRRIAVNLSMNDIADGNVSVLRSPAVHMEADFSSGDVFDQVGLAINFNHLAFNEMAC